jgi:ketosteroid isomerase-like protein
MCFLPGALPSGSDRDSVESEHNRHENVVYPRHLRSYEAFAKADTSFIEDFVSRQEGVLIIGTDPNEWWPGYDTIKRVFEAQMQEMGGVNFVGGDPQAYTEGNVGWVVDHPKLRLPDGPAIPFRTTSVFVKEDGEWKLVQTHSSVGVPNEELISRALTV